MITNGFSGSNSNNEGNNDVTVMTAATGSKDRYQKQPNNEQWRKLDRLLSTDIRFQLFWVFRFPQKFDFYGISSFVNLPKFLKWNPLWTNSSFCPEYGFSERHMLRTPVHGMRKESSWLYIKSQILVHFMRTFSQHERTKKEILVYLYY